MHPRVRLALMAAASLVLVGALVAVLSLSSGDDGGVGYAGATPPRDLPAADFTLRDQDGRRVSLASYRGQVVVLGFMYTHCRDTCPLMATTIGIAMSRLKHKAPAFAISVDPKNDTPSSARDFLVQRQVVGQLDFLLGARQQLAPIWRQYGIRPQGDGYEHSADVLVLGRSGRVVSAFPVSQLTAESLAHDVERAQRA